MFITAVAPNLLVVSLAAETAGVEYPKKVWLYAEPNEDGTYEMITDPKVIEELKK